MKAAALACVFALVACCAGALAAAEDFPARPIRIVLPSGAGGITDILARIIAQKLSERFGQQVIVDNRPGASGVLGSEIVARAAPDGYTLVMVFPTHAVNPSLIAKLPYDTVRAFAPITLVSTVATVMVVPVNSPAKSVREFIALAREKPGQINYGSVGRGTLGHLSAELLRSMTGINMVHITYKGAPQVMTAVIAGEVNMYLIASAGSAAAQVRAGKVRALGVSTLHRQAALPDVPPIADTVPGYEARGWNGLLAPAGTPQAIVARLHDEVVRVVQSREFRDQLATEGAEPVANRPDEFAAIIRADIAKWAKVIADAGIRAE